MSYCDDCLHVNMCAHEGMGDEAMAFCADKLLCSNLNAIIIPKDATNGDIIKIIFPDAIVEEIYGTFDKALLGYAIRLGGVRQEFILEWWNSPYKRKKKNE